MGHTVKVYSFHENWGMADIVDSLLKETSSQNESIQWLARQLMLTGCVAFIFVSDDTSWLLGGVMMFNVVCMG